MPGFGIVSHVISTFSGKPVFGYIGMVKIGPLYLKSYSCRGIGKRESLLYFWEYSLKLNYTIFS